MTAKALSRRHPARILGRLAPLLACGLLPGVVRAAGGTLEFKFNPRDGTRFVETERVEKINTRGAGQPEKQVAETETEYVIRKSQGGWSVSARPVKPRDLRVAGDLAATANTILSSLNFTYDLDPQGRLRRVRGIDRALEEVERATGFGKREFSALLGDINLEEYVASAFRQRELFSLMSGARVEPDREERTTGRFSAIADVVVDGSARRLVTFPIPCGRGRCARVDFTVDAKDDRIGQALVDLMRNALVRTMRMLAPDAGIEGQIPPMSASGSTLSLSTVRLIDPDTGLPYSEKSARTVKATLQIAGEAMDLVMTEKHDCRYTYR